VAAGSSKPPLVFAHRGSSALEPEHSLAAYQLALAEGVDGLECDVRLTRDGHLVCLHDRRLERVSDGRGLVSEHTLAQLQQLDFAAARGTALPADAARSAVLPLADLLAAAVSAGRPLTLLIETKHPNRYGGEVEHRLIRLLREYGQLPGDSPGLVRIAVMSFSPWALGRVRALAPELPLVMLLERRIPGFVRGRLPFGATIAGPGIALVRKHRDLVKRLHDRGNEVYVWTVNTAADLDLVLALGVAGVITDRPAFVRKRLADRYG
jgi:glycerophosphoryl diester phosphodiesterase